ncbi:glucose-methanol-choline oxidoreductase [Xylaria bambusicola]|uniref:glucose-methanol-choline oxidoreductase n=1 Tax=Xylaria bambusicola TaxID=326684 RepID=UPI0020086883|nr:glucose-methanol-choline oxidoreductase [Xylaria bambusicola]KAI0514386.1 glucose-methanol-choline oxidoreductase [Xylaria bambusicola]
MPAVIPTTVGVSIEEAQSSGTDFDTTNGVETVNGLHKRMNGVNGLNGLNGRAETWPGSARPSSRGSSNGTGVTDHHTAHEYEAGGPRSRPFAHMRTWADDPKVMAFPRISKPMELMKHAYDCVVIGSGYGGGVAAARMARAGKHVCVLERGKERWPGEFPTGTGDALDQLHYSGQIVPPWLPKKVVHGGDPTAMYHLIFGNGQNALVGNGLGGTSLINANVFLEADEDALQLEQWPKEIKDNKGCLREYYDKAAEVLEPEEYPDDWPDLPKLELLKRQAQYLNMSEKFSRVRQTTRFRNGPNSCGVEMSASASTGQDATGLNDGSKNTTLVTYLSDAWNWGADMFCQSEVRYITEAFKDNGEKDGYIVYFAWHGGNRGHFKANLHDDLMWVHAKEAVFLGAGAIGSTEILLRSKQMGLKMSDKVGQNMSGNGDMLAFGYNTDYEVNAMGRRFPSPYHPIGPCITGIIDNRKGHENPLDGYVIEEGTIPGALVPFMQTLLELMPGSIETSDESLFDRVKANLARAGSFFLGPYFRKGAIERTQVYLIMSHDSNQAYLTLKEDKPVLEFIGVGRSDHVKYLNRILEKATRAVGGTFVQNPFYSLLGQQQITVHPIGGACMADSGDMGVTNHAGEVFTGDGTDTHDGLIVTDGAILPCSLGANPFATITALAERSLDLYAKRKQLSISAKKNELLDLFGSPEHPKYRRKPCVEDCHVHVEERKEEEEIYHAHKSITSARRLKDGGFGFTEVMSGHIHRLHNDSSMLKDNIDDYELAARTAKSMCETARFFLSVQAFNTRSVVNDPKHSANLTGTFSCPTLEGSPFMVRRGNFNLFLVDTKAPGTRNLTYDFDMFGTNERRLHFHGYKVVDSSVALSPAQFWRSTSTLYVHITERPPKGTREQGGQDEDYCPKGKVIAQGIMRIQPKDFLSEILTLSPTGSSIFNKIKSVANFMTFFTRKSMNLFLAPLTPLQYPSPAYTGFVNNTPRTKSYKITARDGVRTSLHMWEPTNTSVETKNLFMIPGASVDHQIFALPTIRMNAVNYFQRAGYRVFIPVHRIGVLMVAQNDWTTFDARLDLLACLEFIRKRYPTYAEPVQDNEEKPEPEPIYTIAHCMGSVAFATGLLDGTIPAKWIKGVTCSQVFMNPIWNCMNMIKILALPIPADRLYRFFAGNWFSCSTGKNDSYVQKALNELLRFMPDERKEICNNATCHRVSLVFARCWNHRNLNEATHRQIDRFFGGVNMTLLHLLMKQGFQGHVMSNGPLYERLDTPENVRKLRGIPFLLFVGGDNAVLSPESTERTYEVLTDAFGTRKDDGIEYRRRVVPDYGHLDCWMGRNAWKDVYPFVLTEVDRVVRGPKYKFEEPNDEFKMLMDSGELLAQ